MTTLRYHDGQAYIEANEDDPFPVRLPTENVLLKAKQVSVTTSLTQLAEANPTRRSIKVTNITGTAAVFIGTDSQLSTSNGDYLAAGAGSYVVYTGSDPLYGIVSATTQTVAVAEETLQ